MKAAILVLSFFCASLPFSLKGQHSNYCRAYPLQCDAYWAFIAQHRTLIHKTLTQYQCPTALALAIVSPEIAHFNFQKNELEYQALLLFYVEQGAEFSDYSIGYFQMKTSFAEQLEKEVAKRSQLQHFASKLAVHGPLPAQRLERLKRLYSLEGQLLYLAVYYQLMCIKYPIEDKERRIEFYAAAYNRNYLAAAAEISRWSKVAWFPNYGKEPSFPFSSISLYFYQYLKHLF